MKYAEKLIQGIFKVTLEVDGRIILKRN